MYSMNPIGFVNSIFTFKNGTPRQPSLCPYARGTLVIEKSLFNNPEHSLEDLDQFSHVWVIFVFHKNNNTFTKAKVKPPRLNGKRVGVFSTRSPYRPNPVGLTLAKLEKIEGSTLYLSGIDLLDGTPVLDIKPYIPSYDIPDKTSMHTQDNLGDGGETYTEIDSPHQSDEGKTVVSESDTCNILDEGKTLVSESDMCNILDECQENDVKHSQCSGQNLRILDKKSVKESESNFTKNYDIQTNDRPDVSYEKPNLEEDVTILKCGTNLNNEPECGENDILCKQAPPTLVKTTSSEDSNEINTNALNSHETDTKTADWINTPPIEKLSVRFTNYAFEQLDNFTSSAKNKDFCLKYLKSSKEVYQAISDILCQDPRSVYRRKHCIDHLYYFVVDVVHVTAWFDGLVAEVVRLQPVSIVEYCKNLKQ